MSALTSIPSQLPANEAHAISRILSGERDLYYDLIAPYERLVYRSALSVLGNQADAEDCAQEAFLKAFQNLGKFRGECKFSSWLVRIVLNEAKLWLRKLRPGLYQCLEKKTDPDDQYTPQYLADWREIPSDALERKEIQELLKNAVTNLPDIYRDVFVLRDIEHLNVAETAQVLGVSDEVVKTRLLRARMQLRDALAPVFKNGATFGRHAFKKGRNPWL